MCCEEVINQLFITDLFKIFCLWKKQKKIFFLKMCFDGGTRKLKIHELNKTDLIDNMKILIKWIRLRRDKQFTCID